MKKIFLIPLILLTFSAFAQIENDCNDVNKLNCCPSLEDGYEPKIPPVKDIHQTVYKIAEYDMFPKILEYKGYIFREVISKAVQNMDNNISFYYCIPKTRQRIQVNITDYSDPFFETKTGKAVKNLDLIYFNNPKSGVIFGAHNVSPVNKKYKKSIIMSMRFSPYGGKSDDVFYIAYVNDRYLIKINIDDKPKRFTEPIQVEEFLKEYIANINLIEK